MSERFNVLRVLVRSGGLAFMAIVSVEVGAVFFWVALDPQEKPAPLRVELMLCAFLFLALGLRGAFMLVRSYLSGRSPQAL